MNLVLNLKKEYFNDIKNGVKKEEYRLCNDYWKKRLENKKFDNVIIKMGYPKNTDLDKILVFPWNGYIIKNIKHKHFGDETVKVYAIQIHK